MTEQSFTEQLRDILTILRLADETPLTQEQRDEIKRKMNFYLGSLLNHE